MQGHIKTAVHSKKFKVFSSAGKIIATTFCDYHTIFLIESENKNVNSNEVYYDIILWQLRETIKNIGNEISQSNEGFPRTREGTELDPDRGRIGRRALNAIRINQTGRASESTSSRRSRRRRRAAPRRARRPAYPDSTPLDPK
ncbi:hypothetical protein EVAR_76415_1 [Eumeta japonica]|uniref:Uncharacterized protein n=1 Tax=Eumeta variegata TaxID=151549 RepID=A0A4C1T8W7_EUMVA|nr:hypothetical protein EVAR_76415_1 [Eumeta japonica]